MSKLKAIITAVDIFGKRLSDSLSESFHANDASALTKSLTDETEQLLQQTFRAIVGVKENEKTLAADDWRHIAERYKLTLSHVLTTLIDKVADKRTINPECLAAFIQFQQQFTGILANLEQVLNQDRRANQGNHNLSNLSKLSTSKMVAGQKSLTRKNLVPFYMPWPNAARECQYQNMTTPALLALTKMVLADYHNAVSNRGLSCILLTELNRRNDVEPADRLSLLFCMQREDGHLDIEPVKADEKQCYNLYISKLMEPVNDVTALETSIKQKLVRAHCHEMNYWSNDDSSPIRQALMSLSIDDQVNVLLSFLQSCMTLGKQSATNVAKSAPEIKRPVASSVADVTLRSCSILFSHLVELHQSVDVHIEPLSDSDESDSEDDEDVALTDSKQHYFVPSKMTVLAELLNQFTIYPVIGTQVLSYYVTFVREQTESIDNRWNEPAGKLVTLFNAINTLSAAEILLSAVVGCTGSFRQRFHPELLAVWLSRSVFVSAVDAEHSALPATFMQDVINAIVAIRDVEQLSAIISTIDSTLLSRLLQSQYIMNKVLAEPELQWICLTKDIGEQQKVKILGNLSLTFEQMQTLLLQASSTRVQDAVLTQFMSHIRLTDPKNHLVPLNAQEQQERQRLQAQFCQLLVAASNNHELVTKLTKQCKATIANLPVTLQDVLLHQQRNPLVSNSLLPHIKQTCQENLTRLASLLGIDTDSIVDRFWVQSLANETKAQAGLPAAIENYKFNDEQRQQIRSSDAAINRAALLQQLSQEGGYCQLLIECYSSSFLLALAIETGNPPGFLERVVVPALKRDYKYLSTQDQDTAKDILTWQLQRLVTAFPRSRRVFGVVYSDPLFKQHIAFATLKTTMINRLDQDEAVVINKFASVARNASSDVSLKAGLLNDSKVMFDIARRPLCELVVDDALTSTKLMVKIVKYIITEHISRIKASSMMPEYEYDMSNWQWIIDDIYSVCEESRQRLCRFAILALAVQQTQKNRFARSLNLNSDKMHELLLKIAYINMPVRDRFDFAKQAPIEDIHVALAQVGELQPAQIADLLVSRMDLAIADLSTMVTDLPSMNAHLLEQLATFQGDAEQDVKARQRLTAFRGQLIVNKIIETESFDQVRQLDQHRTALMDYLAAIDCTKNALRKSLPRLLDPLNFKLINVIIEHEPLNNREMCDLLCRNFNMPSILVERLWPDTMTVKELDEIILGVMEHMGDELFQSTHENHLSLMQHYPDYQTQTAPTFLRLLDARLMKLRANDAMLPAQKSAILDFNYHAVYLATKNETQPVLAYCRSDEIQHLMELQNALATDFKNEQRPANLPELYRVRGDHCYIDYQWYAKMVAKRELVDAARQRVREQGWLVLPDKPYHALSPEGQATRLIAAADLQALNRAAAAPVAANAKW